MSMLFLDNPVYGRRYSYSDLIDDLNGSTEQPKYVQVKDTYSVFLAYIRTILGNLHTVLFDADFSNAEIDALVPDPDERGRTYTFSLGRPISSREDLVSRLNSESQGRIGFFTSGTTGLPKRVDHSLKTLARSVKCSQSLAQAIWGLAYNPTHMAGGQVFLQAVLNGCSMVNVFGLARDEILKTLIQHNVTHISATPTFYRMLLPGDTTVPSIERVTFGGERMDPSLEAKLKDLFPGARFLNVYASTEAGTILAAEGEVFRIKEGLEGFVQITDNQLMVHESLLGQFQGSASSRDGEWYPTGDIVKVLAESPLRFKILHRDSQLINVGGYKVNPEEVESAIARIDGVEQSRVYAQKNSVLGNMVCCDIVVSKELSEKEIRQALAKELQSFKIPRFFNYVDHLETTRSGKIKRL